MSNGRTAPPFTADDVVFSFERNQAKNSAMRSHVATVKEARKIDDLTVDFETTGPTRSSPSELTDMAIMSKKWCEEHNVAEPVDLGKSEENYALHNTMGTGPYRLARASPTARPCWSATPTGGASRRATSTGPSSTSSRNASTRVAALLSGEMDMIYSVPPQDMARIAQAAGMQAARRGRNCARSSWHGPEPRRAAVLQRQGQEPVQGRAGAPAFALAIDEDAIAQR